MNNSKSLEAGALEVNPLAAGSKAGGLGEKPLALKIFFFFFQILQVSISRAIQCGLKF